MGICYDIIEHIATLGTYIDQNGERWLTELNIISWNHRKPEYDIRSWNESHTNMTYGVKLSREEVDNIVIGMKNFYERIA